MAFLPEHNLVWAEIPVTDLDSAIAFYEATTGAKLKHVTDGPHPMAIFGPAEPETGVALHLYPGKPASDGSGPTVHLATEGALEDAIGRVKRAGGQVVSEFISIPAGRFFYATDPDGNSISFFEAKD